MNFSNSLLNEVKTSLRVTTDSFDDNEIIPLIDTAFADMASVGIKVDEFYPLHRQAIKYFVKGYFGDNPNRADWREVYENLRDAISLRSNPKE